MEFRQTTFTSHDEFFQVSSSKNARTKMGTRSGRPAILEPGNFEPGRA